MALKLRVWQTLTKMETVQSGLSLPLILIGSRVANEEDSDVLAERLGATLNVSRAYRCGLGRAQRAIGVGTKCLFTRR